MGLVSDNFEGQILNSWQVRVHSSCSWRLGIRWWKRKQTWGS